MDFYGIGQVAAKDIFDYCKRKDIDIEAFYQGLKNPENTSMFVSGLGDELGYCRFKDEQHRISQK